MKDEREEVRRDGSVHLRFQTWRLCWQAEQARRALAWAEIGDWDSLAKHIREGGKITKEIASFMVGVLEGDIKRPANQAQKNEARGRIIHLVRSVRALMKSGGLNQSAAIDEVAEREKISTRTIERALQRREYVQRAVEELLEEMFLLRTRPVSKIRYGVSDTALTEYQPQPQPPPPPPSPRQ